MQLAHGARLKNEILRASHHGRDSGYHLDSLQPIEPAVVVVSVGRKPDADSTRKYAAQCLVVKFTRHKSNIELRIHDNGRQEWFVDRNADK
jgi:competence protein ComEC